VVRCIVQKSCQNSNVKVKGARSRSPGTKKTRLALPTPPPGAYEWYALAANSVQQHSGQAHSMAARGVLRRWRWENQRMLSSYRLLCRPRTAIDPCLSVCPSVCPNEMTFDLDIKGVPKGVLPVKTGSVYRALACWFTLTLSGQCLSDQCRRLHTVVV